MADDAAIQARIAALAGAINRHKQKQPEAESHHHHPQTHYPHTNHPYSPAPPYRGNQHFNNRWSPFPAPRGRGRGGYGPSFQNRTLVNATTGAATPPTPTQRTTQQPQQDLQNRHENGRLAQHPSTLASRELVIEGVRFSMKEDGSKLVRVTGEPWNRHDIFIGAYSLNYSETSATSLPTPKKATVAGVQFFRTKNNNLLRSATVNVASKYVTLDLNERMNIANHVPGQ